MKKGTLPVDNLQSRYNEYEELKKFIKEENDRIIKEVLSKKHPTVIQELIDALQLEARPIEGKYRPTSGNDSKFVSWIVNNKYDTYLTQDNYFTFIHCSLDPETIKRYYRYAREIKRQQIREEWESKNKLKKTDKSGIVTV